MSSEDYRYGEVIKQHRLEIGLTQRQVADQCGITDSAFAHLERELRLPSVSVAERIAIALQFEAQLRSEFEMGLKAMRERQSRRRVRSRAAVRLTTGSAAPNAEDLARDLAGDPTLLEGCLDLQKALRKRGQRKAILCALNAWASED